MESEYLEWVKTRQPARFNLATSGVSPYPLAELAVRIADLEIDGPVLLGYQPLQEAIAAHCGVSADCIVPVSGTSMANFIAMAALIHPGDEVVIEQPAYEPLVAVARYLGAEVKRFQRQAVTKTFHLREQPFDLHAIVSNRTKLIVVTNLHNPSCARIGEPRLRDLAELAKSAGARVLADEVYLECMYEKKYSAFHQGDEFVCTSSLTKAYGLGSLRCGWILAEPDLARRMSRLKDLIEPGTCHPAERLSVSAFKRLDLIGRRAKGLIDPNRVLLDKFVSSCPQIDLSLPDYGTCVFPRMKHGNSDRLFELLHAEYDTDIVPGRFFDAPDHFRIGIGGSTEILAAGLERLNTALQVIEKMGS